MTPKSVVIHHLTDLHIGPLEAVPSNRIPGARLANRRQFYLEYLSRTATKPDFVIISGDFTSYAAVDEFTEAENFVRGINAALGSTDIPRICIVPGNHDVDWAADGDRLDRFQTFAHKLGPGVISSESRQPYVYCSELSLLVHCFNSCHLGGARDKRLTDLAARLQQMFRDARRDESALNDLREAARQDPGYVRPEDYAALSDRAGDAAGALKIAVVHHNPSDVPSGDLDRYQAIVNGAAYKQALL